MAKPIILAVDDDAAVVAAVVRDLRVRYGADYQVVRATSGREAVELVADLVLKDRQVAAVVSDQRMPGLTGIDVLREVRQQSPDSKLVLLTAYADTDVAIQAINDIALDYYLMKPWDPPEERFYPVLDDLLRDWTHSHPDRASEVRVVGHRWSEHTDEVKMFLVHNHVPYRWLEVGQSDEAALLLELAGADVDDLPLVALPDGAALRAPTPVELADALGLRTRAEKPLYDLCIVGAGPAGLAAAVYAASEGLQTVVVERDAPGGQAGQSASIENYLGFPKGLSGADLTHRAVAQASRFGAEMVLARDVVGFETRGPVRAVLLEGSEDIGPARSSSPPVSRTGSSTPRASTASSGGASTTARPPARRARPATATSTSWGRPTRLARRRSTSPVTRSASFSSSAARPSRRRCRSTSSAASSPRTTSRSGSRPRSSGRGAWGVWRRSRSRTARRARRRR
jgi:thioredoxin reductase (NADPH)